ncbi:MAG: hypothetical protein L6433_00485 [Actinomycetia bacterium]|nr:hypothetical protein [Actinomycetes bacterium]
MDFIKSDDVTVIVLGYPYRYKGGSWLTAGEALDQYNKRGADFVGDLDGYFAIIIHDKAAGKFLVLMDRYGIYSIFFSRGADQLIVSDSVEAICGLLERVHLNVQGILEFIDFAQMLGEKTHFEEIEKIPPATILRVVDGLDVKMRKYWSAFAGGEEATVEEGEIIDIFNRHFERGLGMAKNASFALSGGMDSRTMLSASLPFKDRFHCYTFDVPRDGSIAKRICKDLSITHNFYRLFEKPMEARIPEIADRVIVRWNGMINSVLLSFQDEYHCREGLGSDLHITGIGGELMRPALIQHPEKVSGQEDIVRIFERRLRVNNVPGLFSGELADNESELLRDSIRKEVNRIELSDTVKIEKQFYLHHSMANFSSYGLTSSNRYMPNWNTFLCAPFLESLDRITKWQKGRLLERIIIEQNSPYLAGVVGSAGQIITGGRPGTRLLFDSVLIKGRHLVRRGINVPLRLATGRHIIPKGWMFDFAGMLSRSNRSYVTDNLNHEDMILQEYIEKKTLEAATRRLLKGSNNVCYPLTNIMSLELWLKRIGRVTDIAT